MALHPRKFLVAETDHDDPEYDEKYAEPCFFCYPCPNEDCGFPPPEPLPPPPSGSQAHQMSTVLIVMLGVLAVALVFLFYVTICRFCNSRRRSSAAPESGDGFIDENQGPVVDHHIWYIRTSGLSQSVIDSISVFKYKRGDGLIEGSDCAVCLSEFQEEESLRLLPKCGHAFHLPCIDTWLRSHKNCPVCRAPILISNGNSIPGDSADLRRSNLGSREENQVQNGSEVEEEMERDESGETRVRPGNSTPIPVQEDMLLKIRYSLDARNGNLRVLSDLADHRMKVMQELQSARRSVSMDLSMIHQAAANGCAGKDEGCSDAKLEIVEEQDSEMAGKRGGKNSSFYRLIESASYGRALQKGPVSMKRSFSFSGKRSQRKSNSRSQESISEMISMR